MHTRSWVVLPTTAAAALLLVSCDGPARIAEPPRLSAVTAAPQYSASPDEHPVEMLDQCDPATFNAAIGPGTCLSAHPGFSFSSFIDQLTRMQNAPAWRNAPSALSLAFGTTLRAVNRGGEVHTFTRVAAFGGGVVPLLNALAGTPVPAPECLAAPPDEFLPPGGVDEDVVTTHGTALYQCCIHPWMRTTVAVR